MILGNRYAIVSIVETCTAIVPIVENCTAIVPIVEESTAIVPIDEFSQHETCLRHTALDLCEIMICSLKAKPSC